MQVLRYLDTLDGTVLIAAQDTKDISLKALRGDTILLIPQDATSRYRLNTFRILITDCAVFANTLRMNVDVQLQHDDASIWSALDSAGLVRSARFAHLDTFISAADLSAGEKQQISLARGFLRNNARVVIFDETTSNSKCLASLRSPADIPPSGPCG